MVIEDWTLSGTYTMQSIYISRVIEFYTWNLQSLISQCNPNKFNKNIFFVYVLNLYGREEDHGSCQVHCISLPATITWYVYWQEHTHELHLPKSLFLYTILIVYRIYNIFEQKPKDPSIGVLVLFIKCLKSGLSNKNTLAESALKLVN